MRNLKIILEYDGAGFFGFQRQPKQLTIQAALEKALSRLFNRKMKIAAASGRTDTGVHAEYQVVNFKTNSQMPIPKIQSGLNGLLPKQIAVKEIEEAPPKFHARYSAKSKVYEYLIWNSPVRSPLQAARSFHVRELLDLTKMRRAAKLLTGRCDFASFCGAGGSQVADGARPRSKGPGPIMNTVRTIKRLEIIREGPLFRFTIEADGFLHHMVRNLVGTLVEIGRGKMAAPDIKKILLARDRRAAGPAAPAHSLTLKEVKY